MLGMVSRKVWVIARLMMKTAKTTGEVMVSKSGEKEINKTETMLTCTPGNKPVKIPMKTPSRRARIISIIIEFSSKKPFYGLWWWRRHDYSLKVKEKFKNKHQC